MKQLKLKRVFLLAACVVACGDVFADPQVTQTEAPAFTEEDSGSVDVPVVSCPVARPRENTICSERAATCEFGTSSDPLCNALLVCRGENPPVWEVTGEVSCHTRICPVAADTASLDGKPCQLESGTTDADEAVCNMTDGVCACTTGRDGTTAHARSWVCARPISVCPPNRPLAGAPCTGSLYCDYGSCFYKRGMLMECKNGVWQTGGARCQ